MVYIGDRRSPWQRGAGPVFVFAAGEETARSTGTPIRADFVPDGYDRVDPPEAVTVLLHPDDLRASIGEGSNEINADVCTYQPFFASATAGERWLAAAPRAVSPVAEVEYDDCQRLRGIRSRGTEETGRKRPA